jgi:hypothetical protein
MRRCIYCVTDKDESEFNREHGLNQAFGKYDGKENERFVLDCVCRECNQCFGDTIDLKLGRDTIEGFLRFATGAKNAVDFNSYGLRSTTTIEVTEEGPYKGMPARFARIKDRVGLAASPSITFKRKNETFFWRPLNKIPSRAELAAEGVDVDAPGPIPFQTQGATAEQIRRALESKVTALTFESEEETVLIERVSATTTFEVSEPEYRDVTKIALNYVAAVLGAQVALLPNFDDARRFARYGERPGEGIVRMGINPWIFLGEDEQPIYGHYLCVSAIGEEVIAQVCLHSVPLYLVTLARSTLFPGSFGHYFDPKRREIVDAGCALPVDDGAFT